MSQNVEDRLHLGTDRCCTRGEDDQFAVLRGTGAARYRGVDERHVMAGHQAGETVSPFGTDRAHLDPYRARWKHRQRTCRAGHDLLDGGAVGQHGDQHVGTIGGLPWRGRAVGIDAHRRGLGWSAGPYAYVETRMEPGA